tara:strand:- start:4998 stop:5237 length:240 start_codon:yes stop_codon:yes gene_type:complete
MTSDRRVKFVDFVEQLRDIQEMLKQENADRVANSPDTEWDLIQELIITPSVFIIKSDSIMIELDNDLKITGRIKKRRKK